LGYMSRQTCLTSLCQGQFRQAAEIYSNPKEYTRKATALRQVFDVLDADHSGSLEVAELRHLFKLIGMGTFDDKQVEMVVARLDVDHDGSVSFEELFNWLANVEGCEQKNNRAITQQIFSIIDKDDKKLIGVGDFQAVIYSVSGVEIPWHDLHMIIQEVDEDGDGMVNLEEFAKLFKMYIA